MGGILAIASHYLRTWHHGCGVCRRVGTQRVAGYGRVGLFLYSGKHHGADLSKVLHPMDTAVRRWHRDAGLDAVRR